MEPFLAAFTPNDSGLVVFTLSTQEVHKVSVQAAFLAGMVSCLINTVDLLCVVGSDATRVCLLDGAVTHEEKLIDARTWPGLIADQQCVRAFGGNPFAMSRTCEKFSLVTKQWTAFPSMNFPRACFTPCFHNSEIYLPEVDNGEKQLEAFQPASETYRLLLLKLTGSAFGSVSCINDGNLLVLTYLRVLYSWRLDSTDAQPQECKKLEAKAENALALCAPVQVGENLYWINVNGRLSKLSVREKDVIEYYRRP